MIYKQEFDTVTGLLKSGKARAARRKLVEGGLKKWITNGFEEMKVG